MTTGLERLEEGKRNMINHDRLNLEHRLDGTCSGKRVVICEDHPVVCDSLRSICLQLGCEVIEETAEGLRAVELVCLHRPDLLFLDQLLVGSMDGRAVHAEIRQLGLSTKVIVFTSYCDTASFFEWINLPDGPDGVLIKSSGMFQIRECIHQVLTTSVKYIPENVWNKEHASPRNPLRKLTPGEMRVLRGLAQGHSYKEIATANNWSINTARSYMWSAYSKLNLRSNTMHAATEVYHKWVNAPGTPSVED